MPSNILRVHWELASNKYPEIPKGHVVEVRAIGNRECVRSLGIALHKEAFTTKAAAEAFRKEQSIPEDKTQIASFHEVDTSAIEKRQGRNILTHNPFTGTAKKFVVYEKLQDGKQLRKVYENASRK